MIKTKTALIIFSILLIVVFPYSIFGLTSNFIASLIPGWNTVLNPYHLIASTLKFLIVVIVVICYWKISKKVHSMSIKYFTLHFLLTFPGVLVSKINLYNWIEFDQDKEQILSKFQTINLIMISIMFVFIIGQILFAVFFLRMRKKEMGNS